MEGVIHQMRNCITFLQDTKQTEVTWLVTLKGRPGHAERSLHAHDPVRWLTVHVEPWTLTSRTEKVNKTDKKLRRILSNTVDYIREEETTAVSEPQRKQKPSSRYLKGTPHHHHNSSLPPAHLKSSSSFTHVFRQMLYSFHLKNEQRTEGLHIFKVSLQNPGERLPSQQREKKWHNSKVKWFMIKKKQTLVLSNTLREIQK